ncbi:hypothetical protein EVAR_39310_1 [Eumeta japonica]|uniref:Uncharacterized protein n=1 Tax=Eumeta variegata TaxID=151549 RepID=A0A4C1VY34_EUMVA|nr:hypothetical protein EVAR_39310_1 [Eumeta japonica]
MEKPFERRRPRPPWNFSIITLSVTKVGALLLFCFKLALHWRVLGAHETVIKSVLLSINDQYIFHRGYRRYVDTVAQWSRVSTLTGRNRVFIPPTKPEELTDEVLY